MKGAVSYHILPLVSHNSETTKYHMAGKFDGKLNFEIWRSGLKPPN